MADTPVDLPPLEDLDVDQVARFDLTLPDGRQGTLNTSLRQLASVVGGLIGAPGGEPPPPPPPGPSGPVDAIPVLMTVDDVAELIVPMVLARLKGKLTARLALKDGARGGATSNLILRDMRVVIEHA